MADGQLSVSLQADIAGFVKNMQSAATVADQTGTSVSKLSTNVSQNIAAINSVNLKQLNASLEQSSTPLKAIAAESEKAAAGINSFASNGAKSIRSLEIQLQSYQRVSAAATDPAIIAQYNKKITETQAEIQRLNNIGKRGYDEIGNRIKATIGQQDVLTSRLKYFQDQLNYARAPQSFVALNQKIQETENQLNRLSNAGKKGFDDLGNKIKEVDGNSSKFLTTLKGIGGAIAAAFSGQVILSFIKDSRELAARGEGIRDAFSRLDEGNTLQILRDATRGATSDIELMSAALRARNFQIAPGLLAKGLELAGKISRQTGQDVTYLADSFVNGLGRRSLLILDNLQISQVQLRAEIKKTGDFQTAVGNLVTQKLASIGEVAITTADKMAQFATRIANIKELVGQKINFVLNYDSLREANKEFYDTGLQVRSLQNNILPLIDRYDQLFRKASDLGGFTKLAKDEQKEMKDAIKQVAEVIPSAIDQFDGYGNAIGINTDRAKDFIKQQVLVLQALNAKRIDETTNSLMKLGKRLSALQSLTEELAKTGTINITEIASGGSGGRGTSVIRKATQKEIAGIIADQQKVSFEIQKLNALLNSDSGTLLSARQKINDEFKVLNKPGASEENTKKVKTLADVLKDLNINLAQSNALQDASFDERNDAKLKSYQDAISELIKLGYSAESEAIKKVIADRQKLRQISPVSSPIGGFGEKGSFASMFDSPVNTTGGKGANGLKVEDKSLATYKQIIKNAAAARDKISQINNDISEILTSGLKDALEGIGSSIGEALANGMSVVDAVGQSLLSSLGSVLSQLGKAAIAVGIGLKAIKASLKSLNPVVAIAAGVGLIALGAFFSSKASSIGDNVKGGSGGGVTAFANGGVVYGPTNALIGEYAGAKSDPEVVAPLSKLKSIIGKGTNDNPKNNQTVQVGIEGIVKGKDLVLITKRVNESRT